MRRLLKSDEDNKEELSPEEQEVKEIMETMKDDSSMIGQAFSKAQDSLSKLSRYQAVWSVVCIRLLRNWRGCNPSVELRMRL